MHKIVMGKVELVKSLLADGKSAREIAEKMGIDRGTVGRISGGISNTATSNAATQIRPDGKRVFGIGDSYSFFDLIEDIEGER